MAFTDVLYGLVALLIENCTGVLIVQKITQETVNEERGLVADAIEEKLRDFTNFDPKDTIFCEYDPPPEEDTDPKAWRRSLPPIKQTIWKSLKFVFIIQTVCGSLIGLLAIVVAFIDLSTADLCLSSRTVDSQMVRNYNIITTVSISVEVLFVQLSSFLLCWIVFSWQQLKQANVTLVDIVVALLTVIYLLILSKFGITDEKSWVIYPLHALFVLVAIFNGIALANQVQQPPRNWQKLVHLSFTFSAQFVFATSYAIFLCKVFWPWYNNEQNEFIKVICAAISPLILAFPKLGLRLAAQKVRVVHPGRSHVFVCVIYGTSAIMYRIMQTELKSTWFFILLGIVHGIIDLIERLTVVMRDYIWEYLYLLVYRKRRSKRKCRSPRFRRFVADMSIQILLQEAAMFVIGLGFKALYQFMNSDDPNYKLLLSFAGRIIIGLTIDLFFNTISVIIQMRVMNIAVVKVWKYRWRHHCLVMCIFAIATMVFYTTYFYKLERSQHDGTNNLLARFDSNCTVPFKYN